MRTPINGAWAATAVGVAALLTTSLTAIALAWPGSAPGRALNLAPSLDARADARIAGANATQADMASAQRDTLASLREAPANPTAWLRLAYIDSRRPEGLGPGGIRALARSYDAAPLGPDDTAWRLRFAFNQWSRLDQQTRLDALAELRIAISSGRPAVHALARDVSDPSGRLALTLTLGEAERLQTLDGDLASGAPTPG